MGILLATVIGATPAALAGMELAWLVVSFGLSVLILAPWLARRQVLAIERVHTPSRITVHAGKTVGVGTRLVTRRAARLVTVALVRASDDRASRERAPRLLIAAIGRRREGYPLELPLRVPVRGRSEGLRLLISSGYPFGLVTASRSLGVEALLIALPRLMPDRDIDARRVLRQVLARENEATQRHLARGQGLPVSLRDARHGDSVRDLHLRSSLRRARWTAVERPRLTNDSASVILCFPSGAGGMSSRAAAAFEVAVSVAASIVQAWTGRGLEVELLTGEPHPHASGLLDHDPNSLCVSQNPLHHLNALTDLSHDPGPRRESRPMGPGLGVTPLGALVIPVQSLLHRPECRRLGFEVQITVWADAHGRTLAEVMP
ncbi:hypothetical protein [Planctomycetes bacterium Poly30]